MIIFKYLQSHITKLSLIVLIYSCFSASCTEQKITPYKFQDLNNLPAYTIPPSARHTTPRGSDAPDIVYYLSKPEAATYPIAILCTGSTSKDNIYSVIHVHRHLLQEFMDLNIGLITLEQWGVDGAIINNEVFMNHYTRSQRLCDHIAVIEYLQTHPPQGWNGKIVLLGISEGGPLVTTLTELYAHITIATMNWCGAGDWNWREELWAFIQDMRIKGPWWFALYDKIPRWLFGSGIPKTKSEYDAHMSEVLKDPCTEKYFMGMTYKYHADALQYPQIQYKKLRTPFLVVAGALDSIIDSCDAFVQKAQIAGVPITYMRINDMDHYIRKRPDIVQQCFAWLEKQIQI